MNILNFTNYTKDLHMSKCRTKSPRESSAMNQTSDLVSLLPVKKNDAAPPPPPPSPTRARSVSLRFHVPPNSLVSALFILALGKPLLRGGSQHAARLGEGRTGADFRDAWLPGKERFVGVGSTGVGADTEHTRLQTRSSVHKEGAGVAKPFPEQLDDTDVHRWHSPVPSPH